MQLLSLLLFGEVVAHVRSPPNLYSALRWRCGSISSRPSARPRCAGAARSVELRGYERGAEILACLHGLEQVDRVLRGYRRGHEVVDDEQRNRLQLVHELVVAAVRSRAGAVQVLADAREARVADLYELAARGVAERLAKKRLAAAGFRVCNLDLAILNPLASDVARDAVLVERAVGVLNPACFTYLAIFRSRRAESSASRIIPIFSSKVNLS